MLTDAGQPASILESQFSATALDQSIRASSIVRSLGIRSAFQCLMPQASTSCAVPSAMCASTGWLAGRAIGFAELVAVRWVINGMQIQMAGCRVQQIRTAHDIGDALPGVINDHRELIRVKPVTPANHEIAALTAQMHAKSALHPVFEAVFQLRHANANSRVYRFMSRIAARPRINTLKRLRAACANRCKRRPGRDETSAG